MTSTTYPPTLNRSAKAVDVSGVVDTITYTNQETGYGIIKIRVAPEFAGRTFVNNKGMVTLVGMLARVTPGEQLRAAGIVKSHSTYGPQIEVESFFLTEPKGRSDLITYLAKRVKHIDKVLARAIVDKFGEETISVIDNTPERLLEIRKIGEKRLEEIKLVWVEQRERRNLMVFASSLGVGGGLIDSIFDQYGDRSIDIIRNDPYSLARDVFGCGFKKADEIALHLGIEEISPKRLLAAIEHVILEKSQSEGDCFQYASELIGEVSKLLKNPNITPEAVRYVLLDGIKNQKLVHDGDKIYLPKIYKQEVEVGRKLVELLAAPMPACLTGKSREDAIKAAFDTFPFVPAELQRAAVTQSLSSKVSVLTGGPGTGKSSITKAIVCGLEAAGVSVTLMAPTGRSAKRMKDLVGREAQTIHRTLYTLDKQIREEGCTKEELMIRGAIITDELSMVCISLMSWLLSYVHPSAVFIVVGDKDQLPSVGAGAVLRDMIESHAIPTTHLTQIFRQSEGSHISITAAKVNQGVMPETLIYYGSSHPFIKSDMYTIMQEDQDRQAQVAVWCATEMAKKFGFDPVKDCQVLCPMRRGTVGVENLNAELQKVINPTPDTYIERGEGCRWGTNDKVMQLKNNYKIGALNGDIGTITLIEKSGNKIEAIEVDFDGRTCRYVDGTWIQLTLAYASTIHKMQGSESPMIVIPIHTSHSIMLQRNLLYTGLTRGKKLVVLICSEQALSTAIRNNRVSRRNTMLADRICNTGMAIAA